MVAALVIACFIGRDQSAIAHPVPKDHHDRTIVVRLVPDAANNQLVVNVDYRLELDDLTMATDMLFFREPTQLDPKKSKQQAAYDEFTRLLAPTLARNLIANVDGQALTFECQQRNHTLTDETGVKLGHLRCDFVFRATVPLKPGEQRSLTFKERNYELKPGQILLSLDLDHAADLQITSRFAPDAALQIKSPQELRPGDADALRTVTVTFISPVTASQAIAPKTPATTKPPPAQHHDADSSQPTLFNLFLDSEQGLAVVLLLSALIGAAHALTPGHGKTLVAAYLVGQRGTVGHAFLLGLITTITHTGVVLLIALGLLFIHEDFRDRVAKSLDLVLGLCLICLGIWLLLQRLAGRADHVHLGAARHHHHLEPPPNQPLRWTGLVVMGITGGIVPCWDAVAMLGWAVGMNLLWLALPMLLAFSAGLASVLVLVGILVVKARNMVDRRWSDSRAVRLVPIASALFIAGMGVVVCYQGVHGGAHP